VDSSCEYGNEPPGSTKCLALVERLHENADVPNTGKGEANTRTYRMSQEECARLRGGGGVPRALGSIPGATKFSEWQWVWNWVHSALVRINEEQLEKKVAAPV
jgi:hypothetical protein